MKIIAKKNPIDEDMIELYSVSRKGKFLMCATHIDNFPSPIYEKLSSSEEVILVLGVMVRGKTKSKITLKTV